MKEDNTHTCVCAISEERMAPISHSRLWLPPPPPPPTHSPPQEPTAAFWRAHDLRRFQSLNDSCTHSSHQSLLFLTQTNVFVFRSFFFLDSPPPTSSESDLTLVHFLWSKHEAGGRADRRTCGILQSDANDGLLAPFPSAYLHKRGREARERGERWERDLGWKGG